MLQEAKEGTGVHGAAVLLTSVGCRSSLTRATSANIVFPRFFKPAGRQGPGCDGEAAATCFSRLITEREFCAVNVENNLRDRRAEHLITVPMLVTPTQVQV